MEVRLFATDVTGGDLARLHALLDAEERDRADRFRAARDRSRFIARRGQLRLLLGDALDRAPRDIGFDHNAFGKPAVRDGAGLHFSVSHSEAMGMYVLSRSGAVGCDIARRDHRLADTAVVERLFAGEERRELAALSASEWLEGFFNAWTRKEAFVKAAGEGLSHPLDTFAVSLSPSLPATLRAPPPGWSVQAFAVAPDYHAAIVATDPADTETASPRWFALGRPRLAA